VHGGRGTPSITQPRVTAFTPRATARLHDTIHAVVNELADRVVDEGHCEVVEAIARPYPIPIICALLGAPREDWQQFSRWAEDIFKIVSFDCNLADEEPVVLRAWGEFDDYVDNMVNQRRRRLTDDLLSDLIRAEDDGDRLDAGELRMLAFSILVPGTDTTRSQLAASVQVLCDHHEHGRCCAIPSWECAPSKKACATRRLCAARFGLPAEMPRLATSPSPQARSYW
jgi:cytochrome P450